MNHSKNLRPAFLRLALLLTCLLPLQAQADTYRVDLIVFLDKSESGESGRAPYTPDTSKAIDIANLAALKSAGIELLPDDQFALNDDWQHLRFSKRYQPMIRLAWLQKDPPAERALALRLKSGDSFAFSNGDARGAGLAYPVDGTIGLLLGNYLNLDVDLSYTQRSGEGQGVSWRLREKRRMKRDETHHLDSPKLGVLARITKAQSSP